MNYGVIFGFGMFIGATISILCVALGQVSFINDSCNGLMNSSLSLAEDCQELANQCSAQNTQCQDILRERNQFGIDLNMAREKYNECVKMYNALRVEINHD